MFIQRRAQFARRALVVGAALTIAFATGCATMPYQAPLAPGSGSSAALVFETAPVRAASGGALSFESPAYARRDAFLGVRDGAARPGDSERFRRLRVNDVQNRRSGGVVSIR